MYIYTHIRHDLLYDSVSVVKDHQIPDRLRLSNTKHL